MISREDKLEFDRIEGPVWPDECGHGGYVGSFKDYPRKVGDGLVQDEVDVYVFEGAMRQELCLRTGPEGHEYYSPGSVMEFLQSSRSHETYRKAAMLLCKEGYFTWIRTTPESR